MCKSILTEVDRSREVCAPKFPVKSATASSGMERPKRVVAHPFYLSSQRSSGVNGGVTNPSTNKDKSGDKIASLQQA